MVFEALDSAGNSGYSSALKISVRYSLLLRALWCDPAERDGMLGGHKHKLHPVRLHTNSFFAP